MKNSTALYDKLFKVAMATTMATSAIAVVASNMAKAANEEVFTDVKTTSDYYEYVNELFERGFVNG
ncbi:MULTISPECIES: S-layer homology domain-containing protein [unclassified Lysinibacillus]|uniref:S-layer homology domain-containing protein n=1 Tax=unclassified Lysinibacillus TaxID=2636778 RepID=UPI0035E054B0